MLRRVRIHGLTPLSYSLHQLQRTCPPISGVCNLIYSSLAMGAAVNCRASLWGGDKMEVPLSCSSHPVPSTYEPRPSAAAQVWGAVAFGHLTNAKKLSCHYRSYRSSYHTVATVSLRAAQETRQQRHGPSVPGGAEEAPRPTCGVVGFRVSSGFRA